mmetsp:Transcript_4238/g.14819  ORF Transcript_4238/g.14819 Transcript_4238/m.14819 type:complete len:394 (-) Transcript_4238:1920-3101(-)
MQENLAQLLTKELHALWNVVPLHRPILGFLVKCLWVANSQYLWVIGRTDNALDDSAIVRLGVHDVLFVVLPMRQAVHASRDLVEEVLAHKPKLEEDLCVVCPERMDALQRREGQVIFCAEGSGLLVTALLSDDLPLVEYGHDHQVVALERLGGEPGVGPVGLLPLLLRGQERRLAAYGRRNGHDGVDAPHHHPVDEELAHARIHRHFGQQQAERCEILVLVHGLDLHELVYGAVHCGHLGRRNHVLKRLFQRGLDASLHLQTEHFKRHSQDLRGLELCHVLELSRREQMPADSRSHSARPSHPLLRGRSADEGLLEHGNPLFRVIHQLLDSARVDDERDVVHSDGRFSDVRGENDLCGPLWGVPVNHGLFARGEGTVQWNDEEVLRVDPVAVS